MAKILTEQDILNATAYMPIEKKSVLAKELAKDCIDTYEISTGEGDLLNIYPNIYVENLQRRMMYGMEVLLCEYLHQASVGDRFTAQEYNEWGEVFIFNQIDRFKSSKNLEVKNKAYDIVDDYREFYRLLGAEINTILVAKNDTTVRIFEYLKTFLTPDAVKGTLEDLKKIQEGMELANLGKDSEGEE